MSIRFTGTFVGEIWPKRRRVQPSGKVLKLQIWPVLKGWHVLTSLPKSFYVKFLRSCEGNKTFKSDRRKYLLMTYLRCIPQSRTIRKKQPSVQQIKLSMRLCFISNPKSDTTEFPFQNTQAIQPDSNGAWLSTPAMATPAVSQFWRQLITSTSNLPNAWRNETILKHLKQLLLHKSDRDLSSRSRLGTLAAWRKPCVMLSSGRLVWEILEIWKGDMWHFQCE